MVLFTSQRKTCQNKSVKPLQIFLLRSIYVMTEEQKVLIKLHRIYQAVQDVFAPRGSSRIA
jgi:hypothetical protein